MTPTENFRCGMAAVIGRPNVGKSTLINSVLGRKVSIVTSKPQTTRHRILAVKTMPDHQIVFVDTPGLHRQSDKATNRVINRLMNRTAASALLDADVVLFVCDATRWTDEDDDVLERLGDSKVPVVALLNKVDAVHPKSKLLSLIAELSARANFAEIIPVSALKNDNLDKVMSVIPEFLPLSPALFPAEMHTDRSAEFHAAETIREKLTASLQQELPYGLTVTIERYISDAKGLTINAVIWVERDSQKGIVVGKGGGLLKKIGRDARLEIADQLKQPVHLELWVKVKSNWADNEKDLMNLGYESP